jgi:hypothetical protein
MSLRWLSRSCIDHVFVRWKILNIAKIITTLSSMLQVFLTSVVNSLDFDYILFTTDQSFLHITNILLKLERLASSSSTSPSHAAALWWARFNYFLPVGEAAADGGDDLAGADLLHYPALSYPPLPASRSFVLSRRLAAYLAANSDLLPGYSSWAASLAVWLAGLAPTLIDDPQWRSAAELLLAAGTAADWAAAVGKEGNILAVDNCAVRDMEELWRVV